MFNMIDQAALERRIHTFDSAIKGNSTVINEKFEDCEPKTFDYHGLEAIKSSTEGAEALSSQSQS